MRIGSVFEWNNNIRYRVLNPLDALERRGHEIVFGRREPGAPLDVGALGRCDVIQVYRLVEASDWRAVERLARAGAALVWDTDDDLSAVPREADYYRRSGGMAALRDTARTTLAMARSADVVTTSTDHLAERYRAAGVADAEALGNYLAPELAAVRGRRHDGVVIGWIAGGEHVADVRRTPILDALERVLGQRDDVRVATIGVDLGLRHERYVHTPPVEMNRFLELARGWDVGIAPLSDIAFNRARSDVKLKEYASLGIPWLASPIGPYAGLGEREGGRLVEDDGWFEALSALTGSRWTRRSLARRGRKWARSQVVDRFADGWERAFERAIAVRSERGGGRRRAARA